MVSCVQLGISIQEFCFEHAVCLQVFGRQVLPGKPAVWFSFLSASVCERWLKQLSDSTRWPCGSLQAALTRAAASAPDLSDGEHADDIGSRGSQCGSIGHNREPTDGV